MSDSEPADRYPDSEGPFAGPNNTFPLNTAGRVRNAWARIHQGPTMANHSPAEIASIRAKIKARAKELGIELSDDDGDEGSQRAESAPVEQRAATLDNVDFPQRTLTLVAVPYEQATRVEYRGELWHEIFSRAAFHGFEPTKRRVPVSAVLRAPSYDHNNGHLVGKVTGVYPDRADGLVLDVRISDTPAGNETLQLARDDALSPSVGFAARGGDQVLDRRTMVRRINRAFLDHLSMVPTPAYDGARVIAMRDAPPRPVSARQLPRLDTPALDEYFADPVMAWADERLGRE